MGRIAGPGGHEGRKKGRKKERKEEVVREFMIRLALILRKVDVCFRHFVL